MAETISTPAAQDAASPVEISVVIPHLNQPDLLERCLAALQAQSFEPARFEIVVVDNGSREPPAAVTRRFANVLLAQELEPGPGPARNRGVALSQAPILAFTDADCMPEPDWLAAIAARFAKAPTLGILGGDVRIFVQTPERPTRAEAFQMLYAFRQEQYITRQNFSVTANMAVRRNVFAAVGPFAGLDTTEDRDWGQRAAQLGQRIVYAPEARVRHPARRTMLELRRVWDRHIAHFHHRGAAGLRGRIRWAMTIPLMAASPLAEIPTVLCSSRIRGGRLRWLAFVGLVEIRFYRAFRMTVLLIDGPNGAARWNRG